MRTGTSPLLPVVFILLAVSSAAPRAAGLFDDPRLLFPPVDTARTVLSVGHAEIDLEDGGASLVSIEALLRTGARTRIALATSFPAVRSAGDVAFGVGDLVVAAAVRLAGDTLESSGLYLDASCRAPTGSRSLAPFSHASLDGSLGCEVRGRLSIFAARALARYTLAGERPVEGDLRHDHHATLAGELALEIPRVGSASAGAAWVRYADGADRSSLCLSLSARLSEAIAVRIAVAAESGSDGTAAYERMAGIALSYRFSPRPASHSAAPQSP